VTTPAGDAQRFEALYRAHYAAIVRFARRRIDASEVEEVVAETFAIAWRRLDDVPADPLPWLYVVARHLVYAQHRTIERRRQLAAALSAGHGRDPADVVAERERVLLALAGLPEPDREALRLVAWEGLGQRDAARVLGTSRVAFAMRLSRARRRLAAALADAEPADPACTRTTTMLEGQA